MYINFDDIGSFPLPMNINKHFILNELKQKKSEWSSELKNIILDIFNLKIKSGVSIPNYPQIQNMTDQYLNSIFNDNYCLEPLHLKQENIYISELEILDQAIASLVDSKTKRFPVRLSITGPTELYLNFFNKTSYFDIYKLLAKNINNYIKKYLSSLKHLRIELISIDEPSLGLNPNLLFNKSEIIDALNISTKNISNIDIEIHLHSSIYYETICETQNINIIGLESASNVDNILSISNNKLKEADKFLRVGISKTNINNLVSILNKKYEVNIWSKPKLMSEIITKIETKNIIYKRLDKLWSIFGEQIKFAGPDCGLGSWPSQELAFGLLKNTSSAISEYNNHLKKKI